MNGHTEEVLNRNVSRVDSISTKERRAEKENPQLLPSLINISPDLKITFSCLCIVSGWDWEEGGESNIKLA